MNSNLASMLEDPVKLKQYTKNAFNKIDKDNSGFIEYKELKLILSSLAEELGVEVRYKLFN
jgi:Ca2+-binding EF-hand superfamily protein